MKAWKLNDIGDIQFYTDAVKPTAVDNNVIVEVKAAGICGSDIPRVYENGAHQMPLTIGHEFAGTVVENGTAANPKWLGKRVGVFPLIPCKKCPSCLNRQYEMCSNYSYLGSRTDGGFAEYVTVPEWNLIELPDEVSFSQAAMLEPMAVAVHAIRKLGIEEGPVLVSGAGTIGIFVAMFLMDMGIDDVLVAGKKSVQKNVLLSLGLKEDDYCDINNTDLSEWVMTKTGNLGAAAYFDCVGSNVSIARAPELVRPSGSICLVGNPFGDVNIPRDIYWKILRKQLIVKGTWNSSFYGEYSEEQDDWQYVLERLKTGKLHPECVITNILLLDALEQGLVMMRDKREEYIKVMLKV